METKNAIITRAEISIDEHLTLTALISLNYGNSGQGFGGYALYLPKPFAHHKLESAAGHFMYRVMEIAGVTRWDDLPGKTVRVKADFSNVEAIGHIVNDDWFSPSEDFKALSHD